MNGVVGETEIIALQWHYGSDHAADGEPFGGPLCNCMKVAERIVPMLGDAWHEAWNAGVVDEATQCSDWLNRTRNPYRDEDHE